MYACKNSKPQGLEEQLQHELLKTDRVHLGILRWPMSSRQGRARVKAGRTTTIYYMLCYYVIVLYHTKLYSILFYYIILNPGAKRGCRT